MKRAILLGVLLGAGALTLTVTAMQQPAGGQQAPRVVEVQKLKDNLFMMTGGGGNSSVFVTASGVVVVDTKNPGWGQPLLDAIRKVTDKPVTMIINTHTHGDHVSGNVEFPAEVDIVTHQNTAVNMKEMRPNSSAAPNPNPPNIFRDNQRKGLAKRTFTDRVTRPRGGTDRPPLLWPRAHQRRRDGLLPRAPRVPHRRRLPGQQTANHGLEQRGLFGIGYADTLSKALSFTSKNADALVSGHFATPTTNADLKDYIGFVQGYVKDVQAAKAAGKTVEDFAMGWTPPTGYTAQPARVLGNARTIYNETK